MQDKTKSKRKDKNIDKHIGWQTAIEKAESELLQTKPASQLRAAIRSFEAMLAAREPWPGVQELDRRGRA